MNIEIAPKETEIHANWNDAKLYCFSLNIDGKTGWRLPTLEELNENYESGKILGNHWYWSSIECNDSFAWEQGMSSGTQGIKSKNHDGYVRAVRDLT